MKLTKHLIAVLLVAAFATPASAGEVNFTNVGTNLVMGTLTAGQFGSISYTKPGATLHITNSYMAAKTQVVFSYTFSGALKNNAQLKTIAGYDFMFGGNHYKGDATSIRNTPPLTGLNGDTANGTINGVASAPLVLATANLVKGQTTGSFTVTNNSWGIAGFISTLRLLVGNPSISSLTYNVTSLATPLPAALPMFGALIGGMFVSRKRRKALAA
ncbi:MAG: hypothetical protein EBV03_05840 [Proteobacteria bacterium]|nr:hypothetical protein [Pseudomonadota bacterium]